MPPSGWPASKTKVIVTERNTTTRSTRLGVKWKRRYLPALVRRQYPMADAIVAVSEGVADELAQHTGLPREQIVTIHNAVVSDAVLAKAAAPVPHPWFAPGRATGDPRRRSPDRAEGLPDLAPRVRAGAIDTDLPDW